MSIYAFDAVLLHVFPVLCCVQYLYHRNVASSASVLSVDGIDHCIHFPAPMHRPRGEAFVLAATHDHARLSGCDISQ